VSTFAVEAGTISNLRSSYVPKASTTGLVIVGGTGIPRATVIVLGFW